MYKLLVLFISLLMVILTREMQLLSIAWGGLYLGYLMVAHPGMFLILKMTHLCL